METSKIFYNLPDHVLNTFLVFASFIVKIGKSGQI